MLEDAAEDILAYRHLPMEHQRQLHSTNPRERLNKEIKRRSNVVGIFPNPGAVIRLVGALLIEQDDEWAVAEQRYFNAESMKLPTTPCCRRPHRRFSQRSDSFQLTERCDRISPLDGTLPTHYRIRIASETPERHAGDRDSRQ